MFSYLNTYDVVSITCRQIDRLFALVVTADMRAKAKETFKSFSNLQVCALMNYPKKCYDFCYLVRRFISATFICGHEYNTSIANINEIQQIDVGHTRGLNAFFPIMLMNGLSEAAQLRNRYFRKFRKYANLTRDKFSKIMSLTDEVDIQIYHRLPGVETVRYCIMK